MVMLYLTEGILYMLSNSGADLSQFAKDHFLLCSYRCQAKCFADVDPT